MTLEAATLVGGERILSHSAELCAGRHCCVHNYSNHHMVEWKQFWRGDRQLVERICPTHGIGHPDPDHLSYIKETFGVRQANIASIHGCCGCCSSAHRENLQPHGKHRNDDPGNSVLSPSSPSADAEEGSSPTEG